MPLLDINRPDIIKFLVENYEKTAQLRMRWNTLNAERLNQAAQLQRKEKGYREIDVLEAAMVSGMTAVSRDNKTDARNRRLKSSRDGGHIPGVADLRRGHSIVDIGLGDSEKDPRLARPSTDLTIDPIMRPVEPEQKKILYKSRPTHGREVYLTNRCNSAPPEDRYYFAECSSWSYGWRMKDSYFSQKAPEHGRIWRMAREQSVSGPHPDPVHYKDPRTDLGNCTL